MRILRTPDERFAGLAGYGFEPNYVEVPAGGGDPPGEAAETIRIHYVDEGPRRAEEIVLLLHGEPSWSYLYRKMVPRLADAGFRVIAPDLVGFGRSDKPSRRTDYTYARHVEWMRAALFDELGLSHLTLVGQDWGGLIGLRLVAEHPDRIRRVVAANTGLPTGDRPPSKAFLNWQQFSQEVPTMPIGAIVAGGCTSSPGDDVIAAYDAPFPDDTYKEGARQFPVLVPTSPDDPAAAANRRAWDVLSHLDRPFLCAFSDGDPITRGGQRAFIDTVPGALGQQHTTITGGGHFLQEDRPEELAAAIRDFIHLTHMV
jgi:haloalkane dehalogenase